MHIENRIEAAADEKEKTSKIDVFNDHWMWFCGETKGICQRER